MVCPVKKNERQIIQENKLGPIDPRIAATGIRNMYSSEVSISKRSSLVGRNSPVYCYVFIIVVDL